MLDVLAFNREGVKKATAHSVVIRDESTGTAVVIVQRVGELTELLTPEHPKFDESLRILSSASGVLMDSPRGTMVERLSE